LSTMRFLRSPNILQAYEWIHSKFDCWQPIHM
jgi:hypothetical protein